MSKLPYMKWFPADYARDTKHLTIEEDCVYRRLLDAMWDHGGRLARSDIRLALVARVSDVWWAEHRDIILAFFIGAKGGYITHKRIQSDIARAEEVSRSKVRGKRGANRGGDQEGPENNELDFASDPHITEKKERKRLEPNLSASSGEAGRVDNPKIINLEAARAARVISPTVYTAEEFA